MKLTDQEEQELYCWGVKFYRMGWDVAFKFISQSGDFCGDIHVSAVKKYIDEQRKEEKDRHKIFRDLIKKDLKDNPFCAG